MNWKTSFARKITYITAMVLLLFPLFLLGQPETRAKSGGKLSRMRKSSGLSQAELGDIDPVGASMQLATFGMRGIAAAVLWEKATEFKKTEDWDNLTATLNQITKLQPNFLSVWNFQAHNLSYNISTEFDDYRHRYHWVKKGISFLITGTRYNRNQPKLLTEIGRYTGQKIGRSDEHEEFRVLFRDDELFHSSFSEHVDATRAMGAMGKPDNWLVARMWYAEAENAVEKEGMPVVGRSPVIFFMFKPMSLIQYAMAIEDEGILDEKGREAFRYAGQKWDEFGNREMKGPYGGRIRLSDMVVHRQAVEEYRKSISELSPGLEEEMRQEKRARLSEPERVALDTPDELRSDMQRRLAMEADIVITHQELAERVPKEHRNKALRFAELAGESEKLADEIRYSQGNVNYYYWKTRCMVEQTRLATDARKAVLDANSDFLAADPISAKKKFENAWDLWFELFNKHPSMWKGETAENLMPSIKSYFDCLSQLDEERPKDFKLVRLLQQYDLDPNARPADAPVHWPSLSEEANPNR
jgi:hypothetical protein